MTPERFLAHRRSRCERLLDRPLRAPADGDVPPERRRFLREEAEELYWNEIGWDRLTAADVAETELTEYIFPGFLAFIDGLLLSRANPGSPAPAAPRPTVVEDILRFLAGRCVELAAEPGEREASEREITVQLLDAVLCRLHDLAHEEIERLELARLAGDD